MEGHYMSALAQMWASTHDDRLKQKMTDVVYAVSSCQVKMGTCYLSAFSSELFDRFEAIKPIWAPYYTIHKDDDMSDFHANTHIPIVIGSQMRYEVIGDPLYKEIGMFFMDLINSSHSYATG
ncbi:hypothetical protein Fot_22795 [Forsythia ovata]|uniref:Non-reducing end beta-L-arabinofuranosidase-like GH127 catalytic domain-containing protein n=1 Tax=Forsythia ovata TaxID=205694 RepID=A0ABD1UYR0_9LAMI